MSGYGCAAAYRLGPGETFITFNGDGSVTERDQAGNVIGHSAAYQVRTAHERFLAAYPDLPHAHTYAPDHTRTIICDECQARPTPIPRDPVKETR